MKKLNFLFLILLSVSFVFISCDKDDVKEANVQFTLEKTALDAVTFAEPVIVKGTITADKAITGIYLTGVKKEENVYVAKGDPQEYKANGQTTVKLDMEYFVDSKEITHIEIKVAVGDASKNAYISVASVTGEAKGSAFLGQVILRADTMVWNAENRPDVYTTPNTGAEAKTASFFSIHGVTINGVKKHVLTGDELRSVQGLNASFAFVNVLQNTANKAYIGSQRGYMFTNMWPSQLGGGTTGRQCDLYEIGGKAIRLANVDTTSFRIVTGSWIGNDWNEARYKFVDSLFLVIADEATSEAAKLKAYHQLGKIQTTLDNATLGEQNNPTNLGTLNFARRRANAGTSGTTAMVEQFRAGDYIVLKNNKGGKLYYGIMQIVQMYDDTQAFVNVEGVGQKIGQEEAKQLFHKPLILNVKVQTQL